MKIRKIISMFMIYLIIVLPIYVASVFAQTTGLSNVGVYGQDEIKGYAKNKNENLTFSVRACISGSEAVTPEKVRVLGTDNNTGYGFSACSSVGDSCSYDCSLTKSLSSNWNCPAGTFDINLYKSDGNFVDDKNGYIYCDAKAPSITISADKSMYKSSDNVTLKFTITDTACDSGCSGKCSGIKKLELKSGTYSSSIDINTQPGTCSYSGEKSIIASSFSEGSVSFTATAYDNFNNNASASVSFSDDFTKPRINALVITDSNNNQINGYISGNTFNANVYANITDANLNEDSIKADLSELNLDSPAGWVNKNSCSRNGNTSTCKWSATIKQIVSRTASIKFSASDNAGNAETATITYAFSVDSTPPVAISLKSSKIDANGNNLLKASGNRIIAELNEAGAGINSTGVFIDLSQIGGNNKVAASNCSSSGSTYTCYWSNVANSQSSGTYTIFVIGDTQDKLGNKINAPFSADSVADAIAPEVVSISITPVSGMMPIIPGYIQTGNALSIVANVTEENGIYSAVADLSKLIAGSHSVLADDCANYGTNSVCVWTTEPIDISGQISTNIQFNFTDMAGNTKTYSSPINVLSSGGVSDYWKASTGEPSPPGIDRELINFYAPFIWFPVELSSIEGKSASERWPVSVELFGCSGNYSSYISSSFGNKPEFFNYNPSEPASLPYIIYLKFTLEQSIPPVNDIELKCTLKIKTLVDSTTISADEYENVTARISYYNNPLGRMDKNIKKEIKEVQDGWIVSAKWIEALKQLFSYAKIICGIIDLIQRVQLIFYAITKDGFSIACAVEGGTGPDCEAAIKTGTATEGSKEVFKKWFISSDKYCKLINCQLSVGDWSDKLKNHETLTKLVEWSSQSGSKKGWLGNLGNPQDSLILSIVFLCIPGVIYNLQKARVIDCNYINCLKRSKDGAPVYLCAYQRQYANCRYVWGELFNLIPFAAAISQIGQNVLRALSHPLEFLGTAVKLVCFTQCTSPIPVGSCKLCTYAEFGNMILDTLCDLGLGAQQCEPIWSQLTVDDSVCDDALEDEKEDEDSQK